MAGPADVKVEFELEKAVSGEELMMAMQLVAEELSRKHQHANIRYEERRGEWYMEGGRQKIGLSGQSMKHNIILYTSSAASNTAINPQGSYKQLALGHAQDCWGSFAYNTDFSEQSVQKHLELVRKSLTDLLS